MLLPEQNKCVRYWPELNESNTYGNFIVKTTKEERSTEFILREFSLKKDGSVSLREVLVLRKERRLCSRRKKEANF